MKKWFKKNRGLLMAVVVSVLLIYLCGLWFLSLVVKNQDLVLGYYATGVLDSGLNSLIFPLGIIFVSGIIFIGSSLIIFFRTMFPNRNAFNSLTLKSDRDFLSNLPQSIRKEVIRDE